MDSLEALRKVICVANRVQSPLSRGNGSCVRPSKTELLPLDLRSPVSRAEPTRATDNTRRGQMKDSLVTNDNELWQINVRPDFRCKQLINLSEKGRVCQSGGRRSGWRVTMHSAFATRTFDRGEGKWVALLLILFLDWSTFH